jgi:hypothetical protein
VNVYRDATSVDTLDQAGVYFGTTGGQVYVGTDSGDMWSPIARDLPAVLSVKVQVLPCARGSYECGGCHGGRRGVTRAMRPPPRNGLRAPAAPPRLDRGAAAITPERGREPIAAMRPPPWVAAHIG